MPRKSDRQIALKELDKIIKRRKIKAAFSLVSHINDEDSDDSDIEGNTLVTEVLDTIFEAAYDTIQGRRYLYDRKPYRKGFARQVFERDLQEEDDTDEAVRNPWLTDDEFLQKYRMHRDSFKRIVSLIRNHPVFQSNGKKKQTPVEYQLLVFLYYIGTAGSGASSPWCRQVFGIGRGTCNSYRMRVVTALRSLRDRVITWPDRRERIRIAKRFRDKYDFINCIAVANGTLFPLTYEPQSDDAPDYHGRKDIACN